VTAQLMCGRKKIDRFVHKSEKVTKTGAQLAKLSPKQFSLSIYEMSVISDVSNSTT